MTDTLTPLILELLVWLAKNPRPYAEVMEAWRTSCPRLDVWEEANNRGLLERHHVPGQGAVVAVSGRGRRYLLERRQPAAS